MGFGALWTLSDVDRPRNPIDGKHLSEVLLVLELQIVTRIDLHLLRGIPIAVDD